MLVKMKRGTIVDEKEYEEGKKYEVPQEVAVEFLANGFAVPIEPSLKGSRIRNDLDPKTVERRT